MGDKCHISRSIYLYITDRAVRSAIDDLGDATIPSDIEWRDLKLYYNAALATRQFETEWMIAAHEIWSEVWQPVIGTRWQSMSPSEQDDEDASVQPSESLCDNGSRWFGRLFDGGDLWTSVNLVPDQGIGISVWNGKLDFGPDFVLIEGVDSWRSVCVMPSPDGALELARLREAAAFAAKKFT